MPTKAGAKRPVHLAKFSTRKRKARRKNPDGLIDNVKDSLLSSGLVHAAGGYASSRLVGRIVRRIVAAKYPSLVKHATPAGNLVMAVTIYFVTKKWRKIREEALIGAVIALLQSVLQAYMPGLAAIFLDSDADRDVPKVLPQLVPQAGLGAMPGRERFVLPGQVAVERAERGMAEATEHASGPVKYVMPGSPGSGYGAPSVSDFEDATADVPAAGDLDDGDYGIFNQK